MTHRTPWWQYRARGAYGAPCANCTELLSAHTPGTVLGKHRPYLFCTIPDDWEGPPRPEFSESAPEAYDEMVRQDMEGKS